VESQVTRSSNQRALIAERAEQRRRIWQQKNGHGIPIRGRWVSTTTRPQDSGLGPAFDGSEGVDSEDILGIPQIHFATFQYFPDQNEYEPDNPNLSPFNDTVQVGLGWIKKQAQTAKLYDPLHSSKRSLI
jgi:mannan endo-1,4-beta-mannosidase